MRFRSEHFSVTCAVAVVAAALLLSGCAGTYPTKDEGFTLEYRMPEGEVASYRLTNDVVETMEVPGQSVQIETSEGLDFSVVGKGSENGNHKVGVTVEELSVVTSTPQGSMEADVADAVGKSFDMTLSAIGLESELPENEAVQYTMATRGPRSLIPMFGVMFPDLPDHPVGVGDSWPSAITVNEGTDESDVLIELEAVNTLEGFETFEGYECARISSVLTGVITGRGTENGMEWTMESTTEGTGTWYFAHNEGVLVLDSTEGTADGAITVHTPNGEMEIPTSRVYTMATALLE